MGATIGRTADCKDLLREATVRLESPATTTGGSALQGTGFFITPDTVATCAHVIAAAGSPLPHRVHGRNVVLRRELTLAVSPDAYFRDDASGLDLALLKVVPDAADAEPPSLVVPVLMSDVASLGDALWTYGHPKGMFDPGEPAGIAYEGEALRSTEHLLRLPRAVGTEVTEGFSGSAVINLTTGAVMGMLTTSNHKGSAHMLPVAQILARCPEARRMDESAVTSHRLWLRTLSDSQLLVGGRRFAGPRLRSYLKEAKQATEADTYWGSRDDAPPLSVVYAPQRVHEREVPEDDKPEAGGERLPAETVLDLEDDTVLVGGPGTGKSSLLRTGLVSLADRWLRHEEASLVPVRLPAAALAVRGQWAEAIANGANTLLNGSAPLAWPPAFFADAPAAGARWLLLVDGLDEVVGYEARAKVFDTITTIRRHSDAYQVILTTRPLPEEEMPTPAVWQARRFQLLPLDPHGIEAFATRWFTAAGLPNPQGTAARFGAQLDRAGLRELARVPLMAALLCRLFTAHPDEAMPESRYGIYERFIELLRERPFSDDPSGIVRQMQLAAARYGTTVAVAAEKLPNQVFGLLGRLALARRDGDTSSVVELLTEWARPLCPNELGHQWPALLRGILRRSGVLVPFGEDFTFLHQTLADFLAAQQIGQDEHRSDREFAKLFGRGRSRPGRISRLASEENSFARFLVASWIDPRRTEVEEGLHECAEQLSGAAFIADLLADQVRLSPALKQTAVDALLRAWDASGSPRDALDLNLRVRVAVTLDRLGYPSAADMLATLVADSRRFGHADNWERREAARELVSLDGSRGADLLASILRDDGAFPYGADRVDLAIILTEARHPGSADLLAELAAADTSGSQKLKAASTLTELGDTRGRDLLAALSQDARGDAGFHVHVAQKLAASGDPHGSFRLSELALDSSVTGNARFFAALFLARLGDPAGWDALHAIAADEALKTHARPSPAVRWRISYSTGADGGLYVHTQETSQENHDLFDVSVSGFIGSLMERDRLRMNAAEAMSRMGDPRGADLLADMATSEDFYGALEAGKRLVRLGDPRGFEAIHQQTRAGGENPFAFLSRLYAAMELTRLRDPRGPDVLARLLEDRNPPAGEDAPMPDFVWVEAAEVLAQHGDVRGADTLAAIATSRAVHKDSRIKAADLLVQLEDPRGAGLRRNLGRSRGRRRQQY
ncbi:trypsin-like peptidase domain-containing protein [Streptomyces sp. NPDC051016]|uniref:trypsin-like peptidase domain-containing protein n=1 Tax=Streptomyces sp. NPDC051016 TaxID=3365638 RepID=UPI0037B62FC0